MMLTFIYFFLDTPVGHSSLTPKGQDSRKLQPEKAGHGNVGVWKEWKNDEAIFPLFPQTLEIVATIATFPRHDDDYGDE